MDSPADESRLKAAAARIGRPTKRRSRNQCEITPSVDTSVDAARTSACATGATKSSQPSKKLNWCNTFSTLSSSVFRCGMTDHENRWSVPRKALQRNHGGGHRGLSNRNQGEQRRRAHAGGALRAIRRGGQLPGADYGPISRRLIADYHVIPL